MMEFLIIMYAWTWMLLLSTSAAEEEELLKCYMCENQQSNFMCMNEDNLKECEPGMDTCQTMVSYSDVSEKLSITKTCTKRAACGLQINATLDTPCDPTSYNTWVCTTCCYQDGCNLSKAPGLTAGTVVVFGLVAVASYVKN